jgi:hypothetical protein
MKKPSSRKKYTLAMLQKIAKQKGGVCLSVKYKNSMERMKWKCAMGHIWMTSAMHIVNSGSWCPRCRPGKRTIEEMKAFAESKGGKCLSNRYENNTIKLRWQCQNKHTWWAMPLHIMRKEGRWCPKCFYDGLGKKMRLTIAERKKLDTAALKK